MYSFRTASDTQLTKDRNCHLFLSDCRKDDVVIMNVWLIKLWMKFYGCMCDLNDSLQQLSTVVRVVNSGQQLSTVVRVVNSCQSCQQSLTTLPNAEKTSSFLSERRN